MIYNRPKNQKLNPKYLKQIVFYFFKLVKINNLCAF